MSDHFDHRLKRKLESDADRNRPGVSNVRRIELITGTGRRRRWSSDDKARVVEESLTPGANVSEVARRNGLSPQQLFAWRLAAHAPVDRPERRDLAFSAVQREEGRLDGDDDDVRGAERVVGEQANRRGAVKDAPREGLAVALEIDRMEEFMKRFGFGQRTGIDIGGEYAGLMPGREWKRSAFRNREDQSWYRGETVITGIGQGFIEVTPLQLAHATATMAM